MLLGALLDVGLDLDTVIANLSSLNVNGYELTAEPGTRGAVHGTRLGVKLDDEGRRRRGWDEFLARIESSDFSSSVKSTAAGVFRALMEGEARAHRTGDHHDMPHELGTVDTLVDVLGVLSGLEALGVERVYCSPFPAGRGMVKTEHGMLPVPALATMEIFAAAGAPLRTVGPDFPEGETVTPTGAALLTQIASFEPVDIDVDQIGYGLGGRDTPGNPNVTAIWLGESASPETAGQGAKGGLALLETNIDDMSGEMFGFIQERLFDGGARDVWMTPIQMKKNRPGVLLSALVPEETADDAARLILTETSTLGVRVREVERYEAERETVVVNTSLGDVPVKVKRLSGEFVDVAPEYEACREIARIKGRPLLEIMSRIQVEARNELARREASK
jgi:uncharacterized protein (TIGR00299 family) protein